MFGWHWSQLWASHHQAQGGQAPLLFSAQPWLCNTDDLKRAQRQRSFASGRELTGNLALQSATPPMPEKMSMSPVSPFALVISGTSLGSTVLITVCQLILG